MIKEDLIFLDSDITDRDSALRLIIDKADALGLLNDKETYRKAVEAREETMPTSVGFQVAIPHGKSDGVKEPFVAFLRTKEEFSWDVRSENLVNLVFLIGVPEASAGNLHLQFLSEISKKLIDDNFREELKTAESSEEIYRLMNDINDINEKVR